MTDFVYDKVRITSRILEIINPEYTDNDLNSATYDWWKNKRTNGGLGLTDLGLQCFIQANLECHTFNMAKSTQGITLGDWVLQLSLDRKMPCPYYAILNSRANNSKLMVFDSRVASLIALHGSVRDYLEAQALRPNAPPQIQLHP